MRVLVNLPRGSGKSVSGTPTQEWLQLLIRADHRGTADFAHEAPYAATSNANTGPHVQHRAYVEDIRTLLPGLSFRDDRRDSGTI